MANNAKKDEIMKRALKYITSNSPARRVTKTNVSDTETRNYRGEAARNSTRTRQDNISKLVPIKDKKPNLVSIKDKNDKTGLTSIKNREPNLVSIKDRNDKAGLTSIRDKNPTMKVVPLNNGMTRIYDSKGNSWDVNMKNKVKSSKWQLVSVNDGIARIKYENGKYDDIYLRNDK